MNGSIEFYTPNHVTNVTTLSRDSPARQQHATSLFLHYCLITLENLHLKIQKIKLYIHTTVFFLSPLSPSSSILKVVFFPSSSLRRSDISREFPMIAEFPP